MSFLKMAKMKQSLRKMMLLPVGTVLVLAGVFWIIYFYSPAADAQAVFDFRLAEASRSVDEALRENPELSTTIKDRVMQCVTDLRRGDTRDVLARAAELRSSPASINNRSLVLAIKSIRDAVYASDYQQGYRNMIMIGGGILIIGALVLVYGYIQVRSAGIFVTTEVLTGNLKKYEAPEILNKELLKRDPPKSVTVMLTVNRYGHVIDLELTDGPVYLVPYLLQAVRKWRFEPFLHKGKSVPVIGEMRISFK